MRTLSPRARAVVLLAVASVACVAVSTTPAVAEGGAKQLVAATDPPVDASWQTPIGAEETVFSSTKGEVDSLYSIYQKPDGTWRGYLSGRRQAGTYQYNEASNGQLSNQQPMLSPGADLANANSQDNCGTWPIGQIYKKSATEWVTFFHEEQSDPSRFSTKTPISSRCNGHHTRWRIRLMTSSDKGVTWDKGSVVITQDSALLKRPDGTWSYGTDDTGSPRLVIGANYAYLLYRAVNRSAPIGGGLGAQMNRAQMSIARAPLAQIDDPSAWMKWFNGSYSQPGMNGQQDPIPGLVGQARGISWNSYLHRYIAVVACRGVTLGDDKCASGSGDSNSTAVSQPGGIYLYEAVGANLTSWAPVGRVQKFADSLNAWGKDSECQQNPKGYVTIDKQSVPEPLAFGYASIVGTSGDDRDSHSGKQFYIYYMYKKVGDCMNQRELRRRLITLN
ncbi:MAG: hypothetical protein FWE71_11645 [Nocardioidaceae bacterium]|nr:hypothetical protein [Nocardioidaceae bacterium]